jgi:hypothetical protein
MLYFFEPERRAVGHAAFPAGRRLSASDLVNLAHGSLYMLGAYFAATLAVVTGSFVIAVILYALGILPR